MTKQDLNDISDFKGCSCMGGCMFFCSCFHNFASSCSTLSEISLHVGHAGIFIIKNMSR